MDEASLNQHIQKLMADRNFRLIWMAHAKERLSERGITAQDIIYLLECPFRLAKTEESTRSQSDGLYKYTIFCRDHSPMRNGRRYGAVIIPSLKNPEVRVVTVMWEDLQ